MKTSVGAFTDPITAQEASTKGFTESLALAGVMELIETIELVAPAQDVTFSGLNGDEDEIYIIEYDAIANSVGFVAEVRPNGAALGAGTGETQRMLVDNTAVSANQFVDALAFASTGWTTAVQRDVGRITFNAKTGAYRTMIANTTSALSATRVLSNQYSGLWTDTSTNITSLQLWATVAAAFNTGSIFTLYRLKRTAYAPLVAPNRFPPGHLEGLGVSFNTVATVDIAIGSARDKDNNGDIIVGSTLTANLGGAGANGLDTGSEAASTWYALYVIADSTGVNPIASLLSVSFTAPTLPAGYDRQRRVGAVKNSSGSDLHKFIVRGTGRTRQVQWDNYPDFEILTSGSATTDTTVSASAGMPVTAHRMRAGWQYLAAAAGNDARVKTPGAGQSHWFVNAGGATDETHFGQEMWTDDSQDLLYRVSSASDDLWIWVTGYWEEL